MNEAINPSHLIEEMRHDVRERDHKKAALVLAHLNRVDEDSQLAILRELAEGDADFSLPLLASVIAESPMMELSYPEIRQWMAALAASSPTDFIKVVMEARGMLRAVLVGTAAEIGMEEAEEVLLAVLNQERNPVVLCSVIEALGEVGGDDSVGSISEYLYVDDDDIFAAAARALARIASPASVEQLKRRIGIHPHLDEIIVGILWEVQTPEALKAINTVLGSGHAAVRGAAKQALLMTGAKVIPILLENLTGDDDDVKVHTLEILGDIGDESAYRSIRHLLQRQPEEANVRFAAYEALGKLPMQGRGFALAAGLEDRVESVRIAAAAAIERNLDSALVAGIKNMLEGGAEALASMVRAVCEARSGNLAAALVEASADFSAAFTGYLSRTAHPELREFFTALLKARGLDVMAASITASAPVGALRRKIFAVDDSLMILRIYKGVIHQLGFEPVTFDSPLAALEAVLAEPPAAVLTDLNMPEITGVELIRRIRETLPRQRLPIIMVTTQQSGEDFAHAMEAGASGVMHKPFTVAQIGDALLKAGVSP